MPVPVCAACGSGRLSFQFRVRPPRSSEAFVPTTTSFGAGLGDIVRCRACGHMQLAEMPDAAELAHAYAAAPVDESVREEAGQRATARAILEHVELHVAPGRLLDVGCWLGFLLVEARARGWETIGLEPSGAAASYACDRFALDVRTGDLFGTPLPERDFTAVVLADVLEHLVRPGDALECVASLLTADGVVALALPDAGSAVARVLGARWWSIIPTHVHYFTRESLRRLLERHGFTLLHVGTAPKAFTVRYYAGRLRGYSPPLAAAVARAAHLVGIADRSWAPDFRDRMLVIAGRATRRATSRAGGGLVTIGR